MTHNGERTLFPLPPTAHTGAPKSRKRVKRILTYSGLSMFQTCRRKFKLRHEDCLVPVEKAQALRFGSVTHQWLEVWHGTRDLAAAQEVIDRAYVNRAGERDERRDWHVQSVMLEEYARVYAAEDFEIVELEREFSGPLRNPAPGGRSSRSFLVRGKVDGVVRQGDEFSLLEHKTSSGLTGDYIERLSMDLQILLYAYYVRQSLGHPVTRIIYNVLLKPRLVFGEGETEEEYLVRKAALEAKSKSGKPSSAKRRMPESDEEYRERLRQWYATEPRFHREVLLLDFGAVDNIRRMIWDISKELLDARKHDRWHQNSRACFGFGRCAYWAICSSQENPLVIENLYRQEAPHSELDEGSEDEF